MSASSRAMLKRVGLAMAVGLAFGWLINEATFAFIQTGQDRGPRVIELVIPAGAAENVARGRANPGVPESMNFVVGDTLQVRNEDSVTHRLGPLFIPSGATATLSLNERQSFSYACSFQPGKYLGLDVRDPITLATRVMATLETGLTTGILLALYVLFARPAPAGKPA